MKIGVVQICSTPDIDRNIKLFKKYLDEAYNNSVDMLFFPENLFYIGSSMMYKDTVQTIWSKITPILSDLKKYNMDILIGSIPFISGDSIFNRSFLFNKNGDIETFYDKIHLFSLDDTDSTINETSYITAGTELKSFKRGYFNFGLSICYDLRFPELYRKYSQNGINIMLIPSAFTYQTGKKHWEILLKARAIENQSYVIAPNQVGNHYKSAVSFGFSSIVEPDGVIHHLNDSEENILYYELEYQKIENFRDKLPALKNRKLH
ncbi:hypothetical protein JXR93_11330 [bacterium]|nr:hypothetical protein [bacterium]